MLLCQLFLYKIILPDINPHRADMSVLSVAQRDNQNKYRKKQCKQRHNQSQCGHPSNLLFFIFTHDQIHHHERGEQKDPRQCLLYWRFKHHISPPISLRSCGLSRMSVSIDVASRSISRSLWYSRVSPVMCAILCRDSCSRV